MTEVKKGMVLYARFSETEKCCHPYFVMSDVLDGHVLIVNATSWFSPAPNDTDFYLQPFDHPIIKNPSRIDFTKAKAVPVNSILANLDNGNFSAHSRELSPRLHYKILQKMMQSPDVKLGLRKYLEQ